MTNFLIYPKEYAINTPLDEGAAYLMSATDEGDALFEANESFSITGNYWLIELDSPEKFVVTQDAQSITITESSDSNPFGSWPASYVAPTSTSSVVGMGWTAKDKPTLYFVYSRDEVTDAAVGEGYLLWEKALDKAVKRAVALFGLVGDYWISSSPRLPLKANIPGPGSKTTIHMGEWTEDL